MNNNGDAPITGHTLEQFIDTQKTNCKNSSMPRLTLGREHPSRDMRAPSAHITHARDARAQVKPWHAYDRHELSEGVQASYSLHDHDLQPLHPHGANFSSGANASHQRGLPRRAR